MVVYLTFNDAPSGVFRSQVIDVVDFLREEGQPIRLVAFISLRGYKTQRQKIKAADPRAFVVPMFPGVKNWQMNTLTLVLLLLFMRPKTVMGRGVFAARMARKARHWLRYFRIVFDARGAYHAEFSEYRLVDDDRFISRVQILEEKSIRQSDAMLAVSHRMVQYWRDTYGFERKEKVRVIPCTLLRGHEQALLSADSRSALRTENGIGANDVVLAYAGSSAGWQSMDGLMRWIANQMKANPHVKALLMTPVKTVAGTPLAEFAERVVLKWVAPEDVMKYLSMADYGLLLRQPSVTNLVASPTKFAEYLVAGLSVLISPQVGDFSAFTAEHRCGQVIEPEAQPILSPATAETRKHSHALALKHFAKASFRDAYSLLLS